MSHPLQLKLEEQLNKLELACDNYLEDEFGSLYPIHPNRKKRGETGNDLYDGLFATFFKFTSGYGSKYGRGYSIDIEIRTLDFIKKEDKDNIISSAIKFIEENSIKFLNDRQTKVVKDNNTYKLIGDFKLN